MVKDNDPISTEKIALSQMSWWCQEPKTVHVVHSHYPQTMANSRVVHDQVNLLRLVTRLEDDVANREKWGSSGLSAWVKVSNTAQVNMGYGIANDTFLDRHSMKSEPGIRSPAFEKLTER